jgi:hypothetical protein
MAGSRRGEKVELNLERVRLGRTVTNRPAFLALVPLLQRLPGVRNRETFSTFSWKWNVSSDGEKWLSSIVSLALLALPLQVIILHGKMLCIPSGRSKNCSQKTCQINARVRFAACLPKRGVKYKTEIDDLTLAKETKA